MGARAERLFNKLITLESLKALIGKSEDAELECKQWSTPAANRGSLAKAACGLANAEGGVIVIGMDARGRANEPDIIQGFAPVWDTRAVALSAREIISDSLEPGVRDVRINQIPEEEGKTSGFVTVYIAEEDGLPQRVRGGHFHVRMSTGTLPMLYSQIADRFGRRPHAVLRIATTKIAFTPPINDVTGFRSLGLSVVNIGRGTAHFPAIRFLKTGLLHPYTGRYGTHRPRWTQVDDGTEWVSYRGTGNDVVHPGESVWVAAVAQHGKADGEPMKNQWGQTTFYPRLYFAPIELDVCVVCEGMLEHTQSFAWEEFRYDYARRDDGNVS